MDYFARLSSREKQTLGISVVVVGGLLLWSASQQTSLPKLLGAKDAVPRTEAQKTGFPEDDNLPTYQTAELSNEGQPPSSAQNSNFGK
jgi:hypothetical protein